MRSYGTGFNTTNVRIGDSVIYSECTLVSMTDNLTIYIPKQGYQSPQWIDVLYCNVDSVELYSLPAQNQDTIQNEEEPLVELQISLVDFRDTGYLFLMSLQPARGPDKIALTVKATQCEQFADSIEKARSLARIMERTLVGGPLSDLQLPSKPKKSPNFEHEALEKRRVVISSLVDSPLTTLVQNKGRAGKGTSITNIEDGGIDYLSGKYWNTGNQHDRFKLPLLTTF